MPSTQPEDIALLVGSIGLLAGGFLLVQQGQTTQGITLLIAGAGGSGKALLPARPSTPATASPNITQQLKDWIARVDEALNKHFATSISKAHPRDGVEQ